MQTRKLSPIGGLIVEDVDLKTRHSAEQAAELRRLFDEHGLLVFPGQKLTKQQLVAAAEPFGGAMLKRAAVAVDPEAPGISVLSNRGYAGDVVPESPDELIGYTDWHSDLGYVTAPNRGKILYAVATPEEGGLTGFVDLAAAYETLPSPTKAKIENLHVVQSWDKGVTPSSKSGRYRLKGEEEIKPQKYPDVVYRMVQTHPVTGVKVLNCPPLWAASVVEAPGADGQALIDELTAHITRPEAQYWHKYEVGDAVLWDNWRFIHAASGTLGRYVRTIWSVTLNPGPEFGQLAQHAA